MNIPHLKWEQIENHEVSTAVHENVISVYTHIEKVVGNVNGVTERGGVNQLPQK